MHPEQVRELLAQEIAEGWIVERPSVQYLHDHFPAVAIGKLGLVLAEGRSPRLTVDSSISGVTAACQIPNHMLLPRISDVEDCAPSCLGRHPWITVSLDVRKAHRMVMVEHCDQALLAFTFEGRVFTSSTLNFGARASAFWWARVGGALLRLSHAAIWLSHLLWGYVDDFLGGFRGDVAPISASIWILLLLALGVPLSWSKCVWSPECIWIGWSIKLESWICELPPAKISKILDQITDLLAAGDKVKFKTLESLIGRLLWVTGLWTVLRPLLSPLYAALQRLPVSSVGVTPNLWAAIKRNIAEDCVLTRSVGHPSFHKGACVTRAANTFVSSKQDLDTVQFRKRRLWVEVKDPGHPLRVLGDAGRSSLIAWRAIFQGTPFMKALRSPIPLKVIAEADAFAEAEVSGLGGYAMWPSGRTVWFSIRKDSQEWAALTSLFPPPLQAHISAMELLAQLLLLWCIVATLPSHRGLCRACLRSEACASKRLSSVLSMSEIVKKFLAFQAWAGVQAEVEHVPRYRNELADALSRLTTADVAPLPLGDRVHPPLQWLLEQRLALESSPYSGPVLREADLGAVGACPPPCLQCDLLRAEVLMLRAEVASLRNSSLAALWDAIYALQGQLNELRPRGEDDHFSFVFTAVEENTAARLLRSPLANVRCLRYHEQRLDALVNLNADMSADFGPASFGLVTQLLSLAANAIALCQGARLGSLKLYNKRFMRICFTKYEAAASLRGPTTMEAQAADRRCWEIIADLVNVHHWKLDDALHEVAEVRSDLHSLLAPRPFIPKPKFDPDNSWKSRFTGNGSKGKDNKQATPPGKWLSTIFMDGKRQTLCMRYQSGQCKDPATCRYLHRCAVPKSDGTACGGNRPASQHVATPLWETHFSEQRDVAEEVTAVPLSVPAQPSGSAGATSTLPKASAPVSCAASALSEGFLDFATCLELLAQYFSTPFTSSSQCSDTAVAASEAYFNLGAFAFDNGTRSGIFQRTEQFSDVLRFLNAFMQLQFPEASWSSLCVSHNVRTRLHTDAGNAAGTLNHTVSLGNFSGGEVWLCPALDPEAPQVPTPMDASSEAQSATSAGQGELRDTWHAPLSFSCESLHCTMPIQGDRWVLTAYTCKNLNHFDAKSLAHLRSLGFPLPSATPANPQPVMPPLKDTTCVELFLDICCGAAHPLTTAMSSCGITCLPIDLLGEEQLDILHDDTYDHLLRLCFSGIVRLAHGSPPYKETPA
ncbi:unnamed protein product [Symbiodinium sp. CCMP2592]|nr:unnamed protein product [Symbiodinium sp. CCMP2592]